jgi:serine/threonine protein kinase
VFCVEALAPLLVQLCAALDYAHGQAKIVHRDLKPANILVTREGVLKVTDFGISRSLSENSTRITGKGGDTSGTIPYMSPQQVRGRKPRATDDLYSLGAMLYELLTGKPPYFRGDPYSLRMQILEEEPLSLSERRAELGAEGEPIPSAWEETILACLAKEPEKRPQSAGEVAERLGLGKTMKQATGRDSNALLANAATSSSTDFQSVIPNHKSVQKSNPEPLTIPAKSNPSSTGTSAAPVAPPLNTTVVGIVLAVLFVVMIIFGILAMTGGSAKPVAEAGAGAQQTLLVTATGPVEVQVREETADGPIIWRGQMEANDSHSLPKRGKLFLTATAMENLQIEINGKRAPNPHSGRLTVQIP